MRTDVDNRKEEIEQWLRSGASQRECAKRLGCKIDTLRSRLRKWELSHLKNQAGKGTEKVNGRVPVQRYLGLDGQAVSSHLLKLRLIDEGLKGIYCESPNCKWVGDFWSEDGRLALELDHINGNHYDNRLENLQILCPTCHLLKERTIEKSIRKVSHVDTILARIKSRAGDETR